jgi:glyoxylase-like metal-dependent hydrolase (beta-lactamase superfamily II)
MTSRVVRVLAPNPSPMTLDGTNSYLVLGGAQAIAIDPGPRDEAHVARLVETARARGARIAAIAVTHGHPDHAPGAALLHALTGAPVVGHATARFPHDRTVRDGERIEAGDVALDVVEAPGHAREHLVFSFAAEAALFTGDTIVGRGTVVIAPPNGDMRAYQATLRRLRDEFAGTRTIYGGHGEPIDEPARKIEEYIAHRAMREDQLRARLVSGEQTIPQLVASMYRDVAEALWPAAARQILAYLIALEREGRVTKRTLERELSVNEAVILNPDLSNIVDPESAAVAAAELGIDRRIATVDAYALVS